MVSMELLKVVVQPVALERDDDGKILREHVGEAVAIYTLDQLAEYVEKLAREVVASGEAHANGGLVKT